MDWNSWRHGEASVLTGVGRGSETKSHLYTPKQSPPPPPLHSYISHAPPAFEFPHTFHRAIENFIADYCYQFNARRTSPPCHADYPIALPYSPHAFLEVRISTVPPCRAKTYQNFELKYYYYYYYNTPFIS